MRKDEKERLNDRLLEEMKECAAEMHDEIMALERDFLPLEEELHRLVPYDAPPSAAAPDRR